MPLPVPNEPILDPGPLLETLHRHGVRYIVVGGIAGNLHGSTSMTSDLDLVYARTPDDLDRLARPSRISTRSSGTRRQTRPSDPTLELSRRV